MKLNNIHLLMSVAVLLLLLAMGLFVFFENQHTSLATSDHNTQNEPPTNSPLNTDTIHSNTEKSQASNGSSPPTNFGPARNLQTSEHSHNDQVDFSKYITDEAQIEEIRALSNRSTEGLVVEQLPNNNSRVNLQGRFRTVNVAVMDENGVVHRGEWAPPPKEVK